VEEEGGRYVEVDVFEVDEAAEEEGAEKPVVCLNVEDR